MRDKGALPCLTSQIPSMPSCPPVATMCCWFGCLSTQWRGTLSPVLRQHNIKQTKKHLSTTVCIKMMLFEVVWVNHTGKESVQDCRYAVWSPTSLADRSNLLWELLSSSETSRRESYCCLHSLLKHNNRLVSLNRISVPDNKIKTSPIFKKDQMNISFSVHRKLFRMNECLFIHLHTYIHTHTHEC